MNAKLLFFPLLIFLFFSSCYTNRFIKSQIKREVSAISNSVNTEIISKYGAPQKTPESALDSALLKSLQSLDTLMQSVKCSKQQKVLRSFSNNSRVLYLLHHNPNLNLEAFAVLLKAYLKKLGKAEEVIQKW